MAKGKIIKKKPPKTEEFVVIGGSDALLWDDIDSPEDDAWAAAVRDFFKTEEKPKIVRKKGSSRSGNWGHTGKAGMHGGSNPGGGHSQVSGSKGKAKPKPKPKAKAKITKKPKVKVEKKPKKFVGVRNYEKFKRENVEWEETLSKEEKKSLGNYTLGRDPATNYYAVNNHLRGKDPWTRARYFDDWDESKENVERLEEEAKILHGALERSSITKDLIVYKGALKRVFPDEGLEVGDIITDEGFISTTTRRQTASNWSRTIGSRYDDKLIFKINVPKGSKGAPVDSIGGVTVQSEILLQANTSFRVDSYNPKRGLVVMTLIDQSPMEALKQLFSRLKGEKKVTDSRFVWDEDQVVIKKGTRLVRKKGSSRSGNWGHTGKAGMHGGSDSGGGHSQVSSSKVPGGKGKAKPKPKPKAKGKLKPKKVEKKPKVTDSQKTEYQKLFDKEWEGRLDEKEVDAIEHYTTGGYYDISSYLRRGNKRPMYSSLEELESSIEEIDEALERSSIPQDVVVYRGTRTTHFQDVEVGDVIVDRSFVSTTTDRGLAEEVYVGGKKSMLVEIKVPKGSKGAAVGSVSMFGSNEREVLLARDTAFRVDSINFTEEGVSTMTVTVVERSTLGKIEDFLRGKESKKSKKKKYNPADKFSWGEGQFLIKKKKKSKK